MVGSGSHCRMFSIVPVAPVSWLAVMVVLAGNECTVTWFNP